MIKIEKKSTHPKIINPESRLPKTLVILRDSFKIYHKNILIKKTKTVIDNFLNFDQSTTTLKIARYAFTISNKSKRQMIDINIVSSFILIQMKPINQ